MVVQRPSNGVSLIYCLENAGGCQVYSFPDTTSSDRQSFKRKNTLNVDGLLFMRDSGASDRLTGWQADIQTDGHADRGEVRQPKILAQSNIIKTITPKS